MELHEYIQAAKWQRGYRSNRQLCADLGLAENSIASYTSGRALPSDSVMTRLAAIGRQDVEIALLDLQRWRNADNPTVVSLYERIIDAVKAHTAALVAAIAILAGIISTAHAAPTKQAMIEATDAAKIYIMRQTCVA